MSTSSGCRSSSRLYKRQSHSGSHNILNPDSSLLDTPSSDWWKYISENHIAKFRNEHHLMEDKSNESGIEVRKPKDTDETDTEPQSLKSKKSENQSTEANSSLELSPSSKLNKGNKRRTKSISTTKSYKRYYSDAFIDKIEDARSSAEEVLKKSDSHDTLETSEKKDKQILFKVKQKKKKYSKAFLNESEEKNENEIEVARLSEDQARNQVCTKRDSHDTLETSEKKDKQVLFKVKQKKKKYSKAFLNESEEKNENEIEVARLSEDQARNQVCTKRDSHDTLETSEKKDKQVLFKVKQKKKKYSKAFLNESEEKNDELQKEIEVARLSENQARNQVCTKRDSNDTLETSEEKDKQVLFGVKQKKKRYSEAFLENKLAGKNDDLRKENSITSITNDSDDRTKQILISVNHRGEKYSSTLSSNFNDPENDSIVEKSEDTSNNKSEEIVTDRAKSLQLSSFSKHNFFGGGNPKQETITKDTEPKKNVSNISNRSAKSRESIQPEMLEMKRDPQSSDEEYNIKEIKSQKDVIKNENRNSKIRNVSLKHSSDRILLGNTKDNIIQEGNDAIMSTQSFKKNRTSPNRKSSKSNTNLSQEIVSKQQKHNLEIFKKRDTTYSKLADKTNQPVEEENKIVQFENIDALKPRIESSVQNYTTISSIDISNEARHPLFRPKARKNLNYTKLLKNIKETDIPQIQEAQKDVNVKTQIATPKRIGKPSTSSAESVISRYFDGSLISSTKLLINASDENSSGPDERVRIKKKSLKSTSVTDQHSEKKTKPKSTVSSYNNPNDNSDEIFERSTEDEMPAKDRITVSRKSKISKSVQFQHADISNSNEEIQKDEYNTLKPQDISKSDMKNKKSVSMKSRNIESSSKVSVKSDLILSNTEIDENNSQLEKNQTPKSKLIQADSRSSRNRRSSVRSSASEIITIDSTQKFSTSSQNPEYSTVEPDFGYNIFKPSESPPETSVEEDIELIKKALTNITHEKEVERPPQPEVQKKMTDFFKKKDELKPIPKETVTIKKSPKPVCTARLVNGKPYRPKPLYRGERWCTKRFYKFLQNKMQNEYGMETKNESEKLMKYIVQSVKTVRKAKKYLKEEVNNLKKELARHNIIQTTYEFYRFCFDYLPIEYRYLVVPMTQAYTLEPTVPYKEEEVFEKIKF